MATEAHRLITVSLGKIAASRGQRGGINLCKNLLVSHVLHQARTQFMMENFETMVKNRNDNLRRSNRDSFLKSEEMSVDSDDTDSETAGINEQATPEPCVMAAPNAHVDKENEPPRVQDTPVVQNNEENMDLVDEEQSRSSNPCGKCTKRRLSEVGQVGDDEGSSPTKKLKSESQSDSIVSNNTTKDSTQISNLLHQFNTGLSGFLSEQDLNKESSDNTTQSLSHSHGHESMSCSTQIKEAFEALSRPSIALAV